MTKLHKFVSYDTDNGKEIILSFDDDGYFYVDGKKVLTEQKLALDWWVNLSLAIGGLSTLGLFCLEIYKIFFK
jgi:hypothetical protein